MLSQEYMFTCAQYIVSLFGSLGKNLEDPLTVAAFKEMLISKPPPLPPIPGPVFNFIIDAFSHEREKDKTKMDSFQLSTLKLSRAIAEKLLKERSVFYLL